MATRTKIHRALIRVELDRDDYAPGETVRGRVIAEWPKEGPARGVSLAFLGTECVRVRGEVRTSGGDRVGRTFRERAVIVDESRILWGGPSVGWREAVRQLVRPVEHPQLAAGRHVYAFEFALPDGAPPTYRGQRATVEYRLSARIDVPHGRDRTCEVDVPVVLPRTTRVRPQAWYGRGKRGELEMRVRRVRLAPDATIEGTVRIAGGVSRGVRGVILELVAREEAFAATAAAVAWRALSRGRLAVPDPEAHLQRVAFGIRLPREAVAYRGRHSIVTLYMRVRLDVAWARDPVFDERLKLD